MSRRTLLLAGFAVLVLAAGVVFLLLRSGGNSLEMYEREAKARWEASRTTEAPANVFRATICAPGPCVFVEVAGLNFLIGAGEGTAEGLKARGLLRKDLDGVLLDDLRYQTIHGLAGLGEAVLAAGRNEPLTVYGPDGIATTIDGTNLMLSGAGDDHLRLAVGEEGEDQGISGKVVVDTGVVTVLAFATGGGGRARVYRIDTSQRSLIYAGCAASPQDVVAAARGARQAAAVIGASSARLVEAERQAAKAAGGVPPPNPDCMTQEEAISAIESARLSAALLLPLAPETSDSLAAWKATATIPTKLTVAVGEPGITLDLTTEQPVIRQPR